MVIRASVKREFEESISSYDSVMPVFHASEFSFLSVARLPFVIVLVAWWRGCMTVRLCLVSQSSKKGLHSLKRVRGQIMHSLF